MHFLLAFLTIAAAYLIGSISFAVIFSKAFAKRDVREYGSGNAGMTNVLRVVGKKAGVLTFICDALKGFAACMLGKIVFAHLMNITGNPAFAPLNAAFICGVACMLGHIFPIFYGFKGGKGVAVSVGIFAVCCPWAIISGLVTFGVVLTLSRIISISSLCATVVVVVLSIVLKSNDASLTVQVVSSLMMGAMVFLKHTENIGRLVRGEEKKLTVRKD